MGKTKAKVKPEQALWFTTQEVADAWGISIRTVYRWLEEDYWEQGVDYFRSTPQGTGPFLWSETALPGDGER